MQQLAQQQCTACHKDEPAVSDSEIAELLPSIPGWRINRVEGVPRLERVFSFANFRDALAFANSVGALAETEHHHPALLTEYGRVTVSWWTHKIGGLHRNDFIMAAKTDELAGLPERANEAAA